VASFVRHVAVAFSPRSLKAEYARPTATQDLVVPGVVVAMVIGIASSVFYHRESKG
jgi:hypothetical protein